MKHKISITIILLAMFFVTQIIGLFVVNSYLPRQEVQIINGTEQNVTITPPLPYGMQPPEVKPEFSLVSIIFAFVFAILLILLLTKLKATLFLRLWFFVVVIIALGITFNSVLNLFNFSFSKYISYIAIILALPLAIYKIFKRNIIIHNVTELMIYPGIAAIFVPILNVWTIIFLLIAISVYDIYAVWHSKFMQNMAKFQINQLKIFAGFFVPYASKKEREKIKLLRQKYKNKKISKKSIEKKKIKIALAILGGGDVVFPIIAAGVMMKTFNLLSAFIVAVFATIALFLLFLYSKKGKFYPAMPFITAGIVVGMIISYLLIIL